jgi:hypothetical protein
MKTKKFNKKLALNKNTIANLGAKEMISVKGRGDTDNNCNSENPLTMCAVCPTRFCLPTRIRPCE